MNFKVLGYLIFLKCKEIILIWSFACMEAIFDFGCFGKYKISVFCYIQCKSSKFVCFLFYLQRQNFCMCIVEFKKKVLKGFWGFSKFMGGGQGKPCGGNFWLDTNLMFGFCTYYRFGLAFQYVKIEYVCVYSFLESC